MPRRSRRKTDPRLAVAYIRVSTSTEKQALSVEAQKHAIATWARKEGVRIVETFVEEVSGGAQLDKRPILLDAVGAVLTHRAGALAFATLDRFSRDPLTAAMVEGELVRAGAEVVFCDGSGNGSDPSAEMVRTIRLAVARFERRMIGIRIKAALRAKAGRGEMCGKAPFGMRAAPGPERVGKDGQPRRIPVLVPDREEQGTIDKIRELRDDGLSIRGIEDELRADGVVGRAGRPLTKTVIGDIVKRLEAPAAEGRA